MKLLLAFTLLVAVATAEESGSRQSSSGFRFSPSFSSGRGGSSTFDLSSLLSNVQRPEPEEYEPSSSRSFDWDSLVSSSQSRRTYQPVDLGDAKIEKKAHYDPEDVKVTYRLALEDGKLQVKPHARIDPKDVDYKYYLRFE